MNLCKWSCYFLFCVCLTQPHAYAQNAPHDHAHVELNQNAQLTLADVVATTLQNFPTSQELTGRTVEAQAWRRRSRSLLSDTPSLSFRYQTDRYNNDQQLTEYEAGFELPLWSPASWRATRKLASSVSSESEAAKQLLHWQISGRVRESLWDLAAADDALALSNQAMEIAEKLRSVIKRWHDAGEIPKSDLMLAQTNRLKAEATVIRAQADVRDAEVAYMLLTTLNKRPTFSSEVQSNRHEVETTHPALVYAAAAIRRAEAHHSRVKRTARGNPTLMVGPRRERPGSASQFEDSFGLTLTVPIGGGVHSGTTTATAGRELAAAKAERDRLLRTLQAQLHEADHELAVVGKSLGIEKESRDLHNQQAQIGQRAYEAGEVSLLDLLKLQADSLAAEAQVQKLVTQQKRLIALYNYAVGELP